MSQYNPAAEKLNEAIVAENPNVFAALAPTGKRMYFPTGGILAQSAEAKQKATLYNATIGIATEGGKAMGLRTITDQVNLDGADYLPYAPSPGVPALRSKWQELIFAKNPSLAGKTISNPVVTNALTHALSLTAALFFEEGTKIVVSDHYWGNYNLLYKFSQGCDLVPFNLFKEDGTFDGDTFKATLLATAEGQEKIGLILNSPNNPTGYAYRKQDLEAIVAGIQAVAETGTKAVVICDDAYFGLFFEDDILPESVFAHIADLHENIIAIKVDGATKEDYVWGLRCGFITYASKGLGEAGLKALESKSAGYLRATVSNISHLSQRIVLNSLNNPAYAEQKAEKFEIMKGRYDEVKKTLANEKFAKYFKPYPYNSGYFMCVKLITGFDANEFRTYLLENKGIGTIAPNSTDIRVAFSCTEQDHIADLFDKMYDAAEELSAK